MGWLVRFHQPQAPGPPLDEPEMSTRGGGGSTAMDPLDHYASLLSELWDLGTTGVVAAPSVQPALVAGFENRVTADRAAMLAADHGLTADVEPADDGWADGRTTHVHVQSVAGIAPPTTIALVAGTSFGHGRHPTTELALRMLEQAAPLGSVLDVGSGSGVLAIAARTLGADPVTAIDIDPAAVEQTRANARRNGVEVEASATTVTGLHRSGHRFDTIVANVLMSVHESEAAAMSRLLEPGGRLVLSGFRHDQVQRVVTAHRTNRSTLQVVSTTADGAWRGLLLVDQPDPDAGSEAGG